MRRKKLRELRDKRTTPGTERAQMANAFKEIYGIHDGVLLVVRDGNVVEVERISTCQIQGSILVSCYPDNARPNVKSVGPLPAYFEYGGVRYQIIINIVPRPMPIYRD